LKNEHSLIRVTYATFGAINNLQDLFLNWRDSQWPFNFWWWNSITFL